MDKPVSEPKSLGLIKSACEQIANGPDLFSVTAHELAAMAKDAERYRWLRERFKPEYARHTADYWVLNGEAETINDNVDSLDAAIDAAMTSAV